MSGATAPQRLSNFDRVEKALLPRVVDYYSKYLGEPLTITDKLAVWQGCPSCNSTGNSGSFKVKLATGQWYCHRSECERGGGVFSFLTEYSLAANNNDALDTAAKFANVRLAPVSAPAVGKVEAMSEVPAEEREEETIPELPEVCWRHGLEQFRAAVAHTSEATDAYFFVAYMTAAATALRGLWHWMGMKVYPNIFACSVGRTGKSRKSTGQSWCRELLVDDGDVLLPGVGSPEGLLKACGENSVRILIVIELATLLTKGAQDGSRGLIPLLTSMYDANSPVGNRTVNEATRIEHHHLSVIASSTREWLCENMTKSAIMGGFGGRFIYIVGPENPAMPETPSPDDHMLRVAMEILKNAGTHPQGEVTKSDEAKAVWADFYRAEYDRPEDDPILDALRQRLHSNAIKLALVYCGLEGTAQITTPQMTAAVAFAKYQREAIEYVFRHYNDAERIDWTLAEGPLVKWMKAQFAKGQKFNRRIAQRAWVNNQRANRRTWVFNKAWDALEKAPALEVDEDGFVVGVDRK